MAGPVFSRMGALGQPMGASCYALPNGTEPLIFLDLKNEVYTIDGEVAVVGDLLVENSDWGPWNAETMITADIGLHGTVTYAAPVLTGDAFDLVASGATMVLTFSATNVAGDQDLRFEMVDDLIDYNTYYYSPLSFDGSITENEIGDQFSGDVTEAQLTFGSHKVALTMVDGKISRSTDGAVIITINPAAAWNPAPTVLGFIVTIGVVIESIGIYPAQPDVDLPALSAL